MIHPKLVEVHLSTREQQLPIKDRIEILKERIEGADRVTKLKLQAYVVSLEECQARGLEFPKRHQTPEERIESIKLQMIGTTGAIRRRLQSRIDTIIECQERKAAAVARAHLDMVEVV